MVVVEKVVGVMLAGPPDSGDPRGGREVRQRGVRLFAARATVMHTPALVRGVVVVRAWVHTEHGGFAADFAEDQSRSAPHTWHTLPTDNL